MTDSRPPAIPTHADRATLRAAVEQLRDRLDVVHSSLSDLIDEADEDDPSRNTYPQAS